MIIIIIFRKKFKLQKNTKCHLYIYQIRLYCKNQKVSQMHNEQSQSQK